MQNVRTPLAGRLTQRRLSAAQPARRRCAAPGGRWRSIKRPPQRRPRGAARCCGPPALGAPVPHARVRAPPPRPARIHPRATGWCRAPGSVGAASLRRRRSVVGSSWRQPSGTDDSLALQCRWRRAGRGPLGRLAARRAGWGPARASARAVDRRSGARMVV